MMDVTQGEGVTTQWPHTEVTKAGILSLLHVAPGALMPSTVQAQQEGTQAGLGMWLGACGEQRLIPGTRDEDTQS